MKRLILLFALVCSACQSEASVTSSPIEATPTITIFTLASRTRPPQATRRSPTSTLAAPTSSPTLTLTPSLTLAPAPSATLSSTPSPYELYTIDFSQSRTYGGGNIEITEIAEETNSFTRYFIRYPSDGLSIYGFANVPKGEGPFPVIVAIHGFVDPATYQTLDYTTSALDVITQAGYIVIHPNLRNYPPSDNGDNLFRVGMAVDVLNLIALIKSESGPPELFATAASDHIGVWAHSLGGSIALRVLTVSSDIKAATLFASLSGDELKNAGLLSSVSLDPAFQTELNTPPTLMEHISPMFYYSNITAPIQLYHGTADSTVPVAWAEETCDALTNAGVPTECIYYPGEDHTFRSRVADQVNSSLLGFYGMHLSP